MATMAQVLAIHRFVTPLKTSKMPGNPIQEKQPPALRDRKIQAFFVWETEPQTEARACLQKQFPLAVTSKIVGPIGHEVPIGNLDHSSIVKG